MIRFIVGERSLSKLCTFKRAGSSSLITKIPWQRVINAKGEVSTRVWSENHLLQRILLEAEGVAFDLSGRVALARFGWKPR